MQQTVLVIAAHPDDEVLGCGATTAKHIQNSDQVHVLILAEGITSREQVQETNSQQKKLSDLAKAAHAANNVLGVSSLTMHGLPDNRMDGIELLDVVKCIETHIDKIKPKIIYTHHAGDLNIDHQITHQAVLTACRPQPGSTIKRLLFFEIPSSTEWQCPNSKEIFSPNWFVDVNDTGNNAISPMELKCMALHEYETEMRPWPHPRSIEAVKYLARWRGASVGKEYAEAFVLGRELR